jgi:hypothetical protein
LLAPAPITSISSSLNTQGSALIAVLLVGSGHGLIDMRHSSVEIDSFSRQWCTAHGMLGSIVGPVLGGVLYETLAGGNRLCLSTEFLAPCGVTVCNTFGQCVVKPPEACSCEWTPGNGFDGYCLAMASCSLVASLAQLIACGRSVTSKSVERPEGCVSAATPIAAPLDIEQYQKAEETEPIISL